MNEIKHVFLKAVGLKINFLNNEKSKTVDIIMQTLDKMVESFYELRNYSNTLSDNPSDITKEQLTKVGDLYHGIIACLLVTINQSAKYLANENAFNCLTEDEVYTYANELYKKKNKDYGNSSDITYELFGGISYIVRLSDKKNRLETLVQSNNIEIKSESINDTILDVLNYAAMYYNAEQTDNDIEEIDIYLRDAKDKNAVA